MTNEQFKRARQALGVTQAKMAQVCGVHRRTVGGWENGHRAGEPVNVPFAIEWLVSQALRSKKARTELFG